MFVSRIHECISYFARSFHAVVHDLNLVLVGGVFRKLIQIRSPWEEEGDM